MKRSEIAITASLVPLDYLMVILAGLASYYIRFWQPIKNIRPVIFNLPFDFFFNYLWLMASIWSICFALAGLYSMRGTRKTVDEVSRIVLGCSTAVMVLMFVFFFSRSLFDSRFIILAGWLFSIIFVILGRGLIRTIQHYLYLFSIGIHRVVIIGTGQVAEEIAADLNQNIKAGYRVVEHFADFDEAVESRLYDLKQADKFDEIMVATPNLTSEQLEKLNDFSYSSHVNLKFVADIFDFPFSNFAINSIAGLPIVEIKKTRLDGWGKVYKRIFDLIFSTLFIVVFLPLFLIVAIAIKLDSRGPLFFAYKRIGEQSRPFIYFKFRSMIKDAHQYRFDDKFLQTHQNLRSGSPMMKFKDDPRVTRVGKFIRRFSIDEFPEFFNVFVGKMRLVGPRPHEIEEVQKYKTHQRKVLTIKPGITGMAQVSGRSDLDFDEEVRLDVWYMENWSLKLDLMILFKTPWAIFKKRQAE